MDLELCTQAQLLAWMNALPLGALVFLAKTDPESLGPPGTVPHVWQPVAEVADPG